MPTIDMYAAVAPRTLGLDSQERAAEGHIDAVSTTAAIVLVNTVK